MDENKLVVKSQDKNDRVDNTKTIYSAGVGEIFWKNFLAGFSRTLGGIFIYLIFILLVSLGFISFILPKIAPSISSYLNIFQTLGETSNPKTNSKLSLPKNTDFLKIFGQ